RPRVLRSRRSGMEVWLEKSVLRVPSLLAVAAFGLLTTPAHAAAYDLDPAGWQTVGGLLDDATIRAVATGPGGLVYAGGQCPGTRERTLNNVGVWDDHAWAWSRLGSGADGTVLALAVDGDGTLYAGGSFAHAGGVACSHVARWNGSAWSALGSGFD